jgi:hypothetical protein
VSAGSQGQGSSTTDYWYGGGLDPLVVDRDGVTYRLIGKLAVEQIDADNQTTRSYLYGDHLGSVRMIADDRGAVTQSLSYDGDWGQTRIDGVSYAATDNGMASFYRYQGQEQDIFPLAALDIDDSALAGFLDRIGLYRFPLRDYAAGLTAFLATDPIPSEDSPYRAFAANPVNFTDPSGGMILLVQVEDDEYWDNILDTLRVDPTRYTGSARLPRRLRIDLQERLELFQDEVTSYDDRIQRANRDIRDIDRQLVRLGQMLVAAERRPFADWLFNQTRAGRFRNMSQRQ